jgi:hypothetical protein
VTSFYQLIPILIILINSDLKLNINFSFVIRQLDSWIRVILLIQILLPAAEKACDFSLRHMLFTILHLGGSRWISVEVVALPQVLLFLLLLFIHHQNVFHAVSISPVRDSVLLLYNTLII